MMACRSIVKVEGRSIVKVEGEDVRADSEAGQHVGKGSAKWGFAGSHVRTIYIFSWDGSREVILKE